VEPDEYEMVVTPMKNAIPSRTPAALRDKLKAILKWGNEYSMRKRLGEVLQTLSDSAFALISKTPRSEFVEIVVNARNYWTHHPIDAEGAPLKGSDLHRMNQRLKVLLHLLLLKEVGVDEALLVRRIRAHRRMRYQAEPL